MALYLKAAGGNSNAAGTWSNVSSLDVDNSGPPTSADDCFADVNSGQLTINAALACKSFTATTASGDYANTITHNVNITWTISGDLKFVAGMNYTPASANTTTPAITFNATANLTTAGKLLSHINVTAGTLTLLDNLSFVASKLIKLTITSTAGFDMGGKTINGNSSINRILITSDVLGTSSTITNATTSFTNADFRDIAFSSAVDLDLSAITGKSGDCGGNTITGGGSTLTFTSSSTQTATGTVSFTWSTHGWTTRVPLPQDDVVINNAFGASQTVTLDMPRAGRSIDWTGATGTPAWAKTTQTSIYGSVTMISDMTNSGTTQLIFEGRSSYTFTSSGQTLTNPITISAFGGSLTFNDNFVSTNTITLNNGTLDFNNFNVSLSSSSGSFVSNNSNVRTLKLGNGVFWIAGPTVFNIATSTNLTVSPTNGTIISTYAAGAVSFSGGSMKYGNIWFNRTTTASANTSIVGSNEFLDFKFTSNRPLTIIFDSNSVTTIKTLSIFRTSGNIVTLQPLSSGAFTLKSYNGIIICDYLKIINCKAIGGATWYAGANSINVRNNIGWLFVSPRYLTKRMMVKTYPRQPTNFTKDLILSILLTELQDASIIVAGTNYTKDLILALSLAESLSKDDLKSLVDSLLFTDSISKDTLKPFLQSISFTDSKSSESIKSFSDLLSLSEISSKDVLKAILQSILLTESLSSKDNLKSLSESITFTESKSFDFMKSLILVTIVSESQQKDMLKAISDSLTLSDSYSSVGDFIRSFTESITLNESRSFNLLKVFLQSITITQDEKICFLRELITFLKHSMVEPHDRLSMMNDLSGTGLLKMDKDFSSNVLISTGTLSSDANQMKVDYDFF